LSHLLTKILIANRGEIACRIAPTRRRLGTRRGQIFGAPHAQSAGWRLTSDVLFSDTEQHK
jgi:acetyl/propionyl-CoA carboxylase alpha subunit